MKNVMKIICKKKSIFIVLLFFLFIQTGFTQLLSTKYYLPKEDDPFFKRGRDIEIIGDTIIVIENFESHILKYHITSSDELEFKGFAAVKGKGPGDLWLPLESSLWNGKLAVIDEGSCSFYSNGDKFVDKFRFFTGKISFAYFNDMIFIAAAHIDNENLIDVYSTKGKKLFDFGENLLNIDYTNSEKRDKTFVEGIFYAGKLITDGEFLYYFNKLFGNVFVFDSTGKMLKETSIVPIFEEDVVKKCFDTNKTLLKNGIKRDKNNRLEVAISPFFDDIYYFNNRFYILDRHFHRPAGGNIQVKVLDKNSLNLLTTLLIKKNSKDDWVHCIAVKEENGKRIIFASMDTEEGTVLAKFTESSQ